MKVLAIDPGCDQSAFVLFDGARVSDHGLVPNADMLRRLRDRSFGGPGTLTVLEQIESFGMAVGRETFETVFWAGRFAQAAGRFGRLPRSTVKLHLCRSRKAKDGNIRQALLDRFGGNGAVGTAKQPGPLRGISSHRWAALAVAVTWWDLQQQRKVG